MFYDSPYDMDRDDQDLLDRYEEYLDETKCICGENDDCCCLSLEMFEEKLMKEQEEIMVSYYECFSA